MDRLKRGLRAISWALAQQGWLEFLRTGDGKPIEDDEGRLRGVSLPSVGDQKGKIIAMIHPPPRLDGGRSSSSSACCCLSESWACSSGSDSRFDQLRNVCRTISRLMVYDLFPLVVPTGFEPVSPP